jgi:hypothetical protein
MSLPMTTLPPDFTSGSMLAPEAATSPAAPLSALDPQRLRPQPPGDRPSTIRMSER